MHPHNFAASVGALLGSFGSLFLALTFLVGCVAAIGVYLDACRLRTANPAAVKIFSPLVWALLCLFGNIPALALYWAAHHSTLAK